MEATGKIGLSSLQNPFTFCSEQWADSVFSLVPEGELESMCLPTALDFKPFILMIFERLDKSR